MFKILIFTLLFQAAGHAAEKVWISLDSDALAETQSVNKSFNSQTFSKNGISLIEIDESDIENVSHMMHEKHHRCGGFIVHESLEEAMALANDIPRLNLTQKGSFVFNYEINQKSLVNELLSQVAEAPITDTISKLSKFKNRYYKSDFGVDSSKWIKDHWSELAKSRSDVKVELYQHSGWPQPSVIMTIKGNDPDVIVVGGHADSIAGFWNKENARAPGADDNASGIATITEAIRILMANDFKPQKTIKFMAYAAEEVGLRGSKEIATNFKRNNINVIGVLQLDMTNFKGSDLNIVMMTDYTNDAQNQFLGKLIDEYVKLSWGYDKCGYACSDHASWYSQGFPASIPFESKKKDMNKKIHTSKDTLSLSGDNSLHAVKFAKLTLAYIVELDQ